MSNHRAVADLVRARIADGGVVGIIGLGAVGSVTAELVSAAGLRVVGYDRNPARTRTVGELLSRYRCEVSSDPAVLADTDVVVIAVRVFIRPGGDIDVEPLRAALRTVGQLPPKARLVLLETTVPPGVTRQLVRDCLDETAAANILCAHCPERLRVDERLQEIRSVPRLVGGLSQAATEVAADFLRRLGIAAVPVSRPEVAELSKLLENTFLTSGIALMGEVTRIAHALGLNAAEIAEAAATKPHGYFPFHPGAGIGGHCLLNDLDLLRMAARALAVDSELLEGIHAAAAKLASTVIRRLEELLRARDCTLARASVWIIGVGFKPGTSDVTGSPAADLVRLLRERGAETSYADSQVDAFSVDGRSVPRVGRDNLTRAADAAVIVSGDRSLDLAEIACRIPVVLDAGGGRIMSGSRAAVMTL